MYKYGLIWLVLGGENLGNCIMKEPKLSDLKYNKKATDSIRKKMAQTDKVKITINFDADILEEVKNMANEMGSPYQTLLNKLLRESIQQKLGEESRLDRLEKEVRDLKKKIAI